MPHYFEMKVSPTEVTTLSEKLNKLAFEFKVIQIVALPGVVIAYCEMDKFIEKEPEVKPEAKTEKKKK